MTVVECEGPPIIMSIDFFCTFGDVSHPTPAFLKPSVSKEPQKTQTWASVSTKKVCSEETVVVILKDKRVESSRRIPRTRDVESHTGNVFPP